MLYTKISIFTRFIIFGSKVKGRDTSLIKILNGFQYKVLALILFLCIFLTFSYATFYFFQKFYVLLFVNLIFHILYIGVFFLNRQKKYGIAKILFVVICSTDVFLKNNLLGFNPAVYLYFLLLFLSTIFIFDITEKKNLWLSFLIISICSISSFQITTPLLNIGFISNELLNFAIYLNVFGCLLILFVLGYFIAISQMALIKKLGKEKITFDKIFNKTFEALILIDKNTRRVLEVNMRACELFKYTKSEFIGMDTNLLHRKVYTDIEREIIEFTLQNDNFYKEEFEMLTAYNTTFHAKVVSTIINIDGTDYLLFSIHDTSEVKQVNRQIASLETAMPGVLYKYYLTKDGQNGFDYISPSCKELFGFEPEIVMTSDNFFNSDYFTNVPDLEKKILYSALNMSLLNWEGEVTMPSGEKKWIEIFSMPSKGLNDTIVWNGIMVDITYKKLLELDLQKSKLEVEKIYAAKDDFLATMSHEIRTPLNSVIGMAYLIEQNNTDKLQKARLDVLKFSADNLLGLINDVLDYSKINEGKLTLEQRNFDILLLLQNIKNSNLDKASNNGIDLTLNMDVNLPRFIESDELRITQIINNLISNAIKFTPNGKVEIAISMQGIKQNQIIIRFEVKDNGIGIEQENLSTVFDRFIQANSNTQRKFGGSGLGLSICKKLVDQFKGTIWVTSQIGKGTTFAFELPLKLGINIDKIDTNIIFSDTFLSNKKILLAEDYELNVLVAKGILERWNVWVDVAENGLIAVEMAKNKSYDLILMDMQMPEMDGIEATKQIRIFNKTIPIIALTANVLSEVQFDLDAAGINDFISKPFKPEVLKEKISILIQNTKIENV